MKNRTQILITIFVMLFCRSAFSSVITGPLPCETSRLQLTSMTNIGSNNNLLSDIYTASECAAFTGNDDKQGASSPNPNIGQLNDGLLNGEAGFDPFLLIDPTDLQALDSDGVANDPGWIHLANIQGINDVTYSSVGPAPLGNGASISAIQLNDLLDITFACTTGNASDCTEGTWSLSIINTNNIISTVQDVLGRSAVFDQLAISIKAGGGFSVYNFDFKDIFAAENNPNSLNLNTPYNLGGTFNTLDLAGKGVSHINVWARDPAQTLSVPVPPAILMYFLSIGLLFCRAKSG